MTLVKNDKAWNADKALFDKIVNFNGETDTISAVVLNKDVDYATHGFAPATEQEFLATGIRVLRPPVYSGPALLMNFGTLGDAFGDEKARQGIATAIDGDEIGFFSLAESGVPVDLQRRLQRQHHRQLDGSGRHRRAQPVRPPIPMPPPRSSKRLAGPRTATPGRRRLARMPPSS